MALDAGSVYTVLGFKVDPAGAREYETQVKKAAAEGEAAESRMVASNGRVASSHERLASSARKSASTLDKLAKDGSKNLETLGRVAGKTALVGVVGLGAAITYAAVKATTFNQEMLKISTQAGGSAKEIAKLKAEVLGLAGQVPQGPQQLAEGLYHVESAGFRGGKAMEMLKAAAEGAALGNANLEATTQAMIATMASNISGVHGAIDAMGQLNNIVGVGDMRMEALAQAMATGLLPSAHDAGLSLKDVGAALATVTDNATPANVTATRLRMTIALMAAPSKAAQKALGEIGLTSTSLAHDMRQPNGLLLAVEDLKKHLQSSGKTVEEQDAILTKVFGGGKSSAVIHTLISEIDRLRTKYSQLGKESGPEKLAKSWGEYQKSQSAAFGELKSGAEALAITLGEMVLPQLTKLAHGAAEAMRSFVASGGAARFGQGLSDAVSAIAEAVGKLYNAIEPLAAGLFGLAASFSNLARSVTGLDLGGQLSAIVAGFLAFKTVTFVGPILASIAQGIEMLALNAATASSVPMFFSELAASGALLPGIGLALAAVAAGFVALQSGMFSSTSEAEKNAAAMEKDKAAIESLNNTATSAARASLDLKQARLDHKVALEQLSKVEQEHGHGQAYQTRLEQARLGVLRTGLNVQEAANAKGKEDNKLKAEAVKTEEQVGKRRSEKQSEVEAQEKLVRSDENLASKKARLKKDQADLNKLRAEYNALGQTQINQNAQITAAEINAMRQAHNRAPISAQNAEGLNLLKISLSGLPAKITTRYFLEDQDTLAKLGVLSRKLEEVGQGTTVVKVLTTAKSASAAMLALQAVVRGVPSAKILKILHNAPSAKAQIQQLHGAINAVPTEHNVQINTNAAQAQSEIQGVGNALASLVGHSWTAIVNVARNITTTTTTKKGHAMGRAAAENELALVGEGSGGAEYVIDAKTGKGRRVSRPTMMMLGSSEYVVPTDPAYRSRAMGLFSMLGQDLGVQGYAKGRAPHRGNRPIPGKLDPLSLELTDLEGKAQSAKSNYEQAHQHIKQRESEKKKVSSGERAREKTAHTRMVNLERETREAKSYQAKINRETDNANIARNEMELANQRNNDKGYQAAKGRRLTALAHLRALLLGAREHVPHGNAHWRKLQQEIGGTEIEAGTVAGEQFPEVPTLTPEEERARKEIEARAALAALTPGLGDDTAAAQQLLGFLEGALGRAQTRGVEPAGIIELAGSVKGARENLASLANPASGATNENPDLQAQITQQRERTELAERRASIAEGALGVLGGPGDIGAGAANARGAVVNVYTLHPGDPQTLAAIGSAATAGMGYQGSRQATRLPVGP